MARRSRRSNARRKSRENRRRRGRQAAAAAAAAALLPAAAEATTIREFEVGDFGDNFADRTLLDTGVDEVFGSASLQLVGPDFFFDVDYFAFTGLEAGASYTLTMEDVNSDGGAIFEVLVPGHGAIQRDRAYLTRVAELLEEVVRQVRRSVERGLSLEETQAAVELGDLETQFVAGDARREVGFRRFFLEPAVESAYRSVSREP